MSARVSLITNKFCYLQLWRCTIMYKSSSVKNWIAVGLAGLFWVTEFSV